MKSVEERRLPFPRLEHLSTWPVVRTKSSKPFKMVYPTKRSRISLLRITPRQMGPRRLKQKVGALGLKFDVVVASSGPWWPVTKLGTEGDVDTLYKATESNFTYSFTKSWHPSVCRRDGLAVRRLPGSGLTGIMANACANSGTLDLDDHMAEKLIAML